MTFSIIDIIACLLILAVAALGAKTGFFKELLGFCTYIFSIIFARLLSVPIARVFYSNYLDKRLTDYLASVLPDGENIKLSISQIVPAWVSKIAELMNLSSVDEVVDGLTSSLSVENIMDSYVMPVVMKILTLIMTVILFVVLSLILSIVIKSLDKILFKRKHSFAKKVNSILGFVLGFVKGVIPVTVVCSVLLLIAPIFNSIKFNELLNSSFICTFIAKMFN